MGRQDLRFVGRLEARLKQRLNITPELRLLARQVTDVAEFLEIESKHLLRMLVRGNYRVLVVEPDQDRREHILGDLERQDCFGYGVNHPDEADSLLQESRLWDAILMNFNQPPGALNGVELTKKLKSRDPDVPVVIYTGDSLNDFHTGVGPTYQALVRESLMNPNLRFSPAWYNSTEYDFRLNDGHGNPTGVSIQEMNHALTISAISNINGVRSRSLLEGKIADLKNVNPGTHNELMQALYDQFFQVNLTKKIPIVIKAGGSLFDLVEDKIDEDVIIDFADYTLRFARENPQFAVIVIPGGGHLNDNIKDWLSNKKLGYKPGDRLIERIAMNILDVQAQKLLTAFGEQNVQLVNPDNPLAYNPITDDSFAHGRILIFPYAPRELRRTYGLSMAYSDAQTLATGGLFMAERFLFVKNTNGIYPSDPNRTDFQDKGGEKILEVTYAELLSGRFKQGTKTIKISRKGTDDRLGHLIEDQGLRVMERLRLPRRIVIGYPRTDKLLERAFRDNQLVVYRKGVVDLENSLSSILLSHRQKDDFPPSRYSR